MIDALIRGSLNNRALVLFFSVLLMGYGIYQAISMPVDVFPDLTTPTVTVITESQGMAPEEVETLVSFPIETAMNGTIGVRRVRSLSTMGVSVVWVEFDWGTDIYLARQMVSERLQSVEAQLPARVESPVMTPVTSIMGEIMFLALTSEAQEPTDLKTQADWVVKRRLSAVPGVAQVLALGGDTKQYQIHLNPLQMRHYGLDINAVRAQVEAADRAVSAGLLYESDQQFLIRGMGRIRRIEDLSQTVVAQVGGAPVVLADIAEIKIGPAFKVGKGSHNGKSAVIIGIQKQPQANTLKLTQDLDRHLDDIQKALPEGMTIQRHIFRQADFIEVAVQNVVDAVRDGAILVVIVLWLFLVSIRATVITLVAIPLSLTATVLAMHGLDLNFNTMTLGGVAFAVGALVDDAVIDVENVVRRLRLAGPGADAKEVVFTASKEIRGAIVFATMIIMVVFVPLFFLSGLEGRLLRPLGTVYLLALAASLLTALTVTPVLCSLLLPKAKEIHKREEGPLARFLKRRYDPLLRFCMPRRTLIVSVALLVMVFTLIAVSRMGLNFLPEFNEGTLTISAVTLPGTSLELSDELGGMVERELLLFPEVLSTARRTGRAEEDEHVQGVNATEIEVNLDLGGKDKETFLTEVRQALAVIPGLNITIGQPISHRIDHMLSGTRANIAVKVFGPDLARLRTLAEQIKGVMSGVDGVVDLSLEQQPNIPEVRVYPRRSDLARYGLTVDQVMTALETARFGNVVGKVYEQQAAFDIWLGMAANHEDGLQAVFDITLQTADGALIPLSSVADIRRDMGPESIARENGSRKIVVMCNVSGRDLGGVVEDIRTGLESQVRMPSGYSVDFGGQYESAKGATSRLMWSGLAVLVLVGVLLFAALRSFRDAMLVLVNLPLALMGGVIGVYWDGGSLSIASMIGFIALFGIAVRNGLLMVSHIRHLRFVEGVTDIGEAVYRGAMERLNPILMTAITAGLALVPLALKAGEPGGEIEAPMAMVILCGLVTSTFLNLIVVPALYMGRKN